MMEIKKSILAGLAFGLIMGIFFGIRFGFDQSIYLGPLSGLLFGIGIFCGVLIGKGFFEK